MLSVNIDEILKIIGQADLSIETKIEDQTYIDNALKSLQLAKAYDLLDHAEKAFHESCKGLNTLDKLVKLRKEQALSEKVRNVSYDSLLAPFYFKAGDFLATYIMLNTDELGTVKPFSEEPESDEEAEADEDASAPAEEEK